MSKVGDWLFEHEEVVGAAIDSGLMNVGDVVAFCNDNMENVDESCVRMLFTEWYFGSGPGLNNVMDDAWSRQSGRNIKRDYS